VGTSSHDVLLVGGGGAGLRAAIAAAEVNPKLGIAVVSKVYPMRSHTASAEGGAAGVAKPDDSLDEHAYDTISGGDWLSEAHMEDIVEPKLKTISKNRIAEPIAMGHLEAAEKIRPPDNDDAVLRWNRCARLLAKLPQAEWPQPQETFEDHDTAPVQSSSRAVKLSR